MSECGKRVNTKAKMLTADKSTAYTTKKNCSWIQNMQAASVVRRFVLCVFLYPLSDMNFTYLLTYRGGTVVKVLRYKSEGRWFDSRWCHWNFSFT